MLIAVLENDLPAKVLEINSRLGYTGDSAVSSTVTVFESKQLMLNEYPALIVEMVGDRNIQPGDPGPGNVIFEFSVSISHVGNSVAELTKAMKVYNLGVNEVIAENRSLGGECVWVLVEAAELSDPMLEESLLYQGVSLAVEVHAYEKQRDRSAFVG